MSRVVRKFVRHLELWLSGAGLIVVALAALVVSPNEADVWKVAAITALGVSVLHGLIFYGVRRRQRLVREQAIVEIREMLADVVKNQLAVIGMWLPDDVDREHLDGIEESIQVIEERIDTISEDSLSEWKEHYTGAIERTEAFKQAA